MRAVGAVEEEVEDRKASRRKVHMAETQSQWDGQEEEREKKKKKKKNKNKKKKKKKRKRKKKMMMKKKMKTIFSSLRQEKAHEFNARNSTTNEL